MASNRAGPFDRWSPFRETTIAHRLFRRDTVHINEYFWNSAGSLHHAKVALAAANGGAVRSVLDYGADLGNRGNTPIKDALSNFPEVENWARLVTVVMTASCLELYLRRVVRLALESDPGITLGRSRVIDGMSLAKSGTAPDVSADVHRCSEGVWSKRQAAIERLFRTSFPVMQSSISELHYLQTLRNSIAHDFARKAKLKDLWYFDPAEAVTPSTERLTDKRVQQLLTVVGAVAGELERSLLPHVGSYEILMFWHKFISERTDGKVLPQYLAWFKSGSHEKLLSAFHDRMAGGTISRAYCQEAIRYYSSLK